MANKQTPPNPNPLMGSTPANLQSLLGTQTPANLQPSVVSQTPANMPLSSSQQTPANMPLLSSQQTPANVPLLSSQQTPANVPLTANMPLMGSLKPINMQQQMTGQQFPANVQPQLADQHTPANVQPQMFDHQTPANVQQHFINNRAQTGLQPYRGVKQSPVSHVLPYTTGKRTMNPMIKGDRLMFSTSDDNVMLKQVQATHVPDGTEIDVRPLLRIIDDIFKCATPSVDAIVHPENRALAETLEEDTYQTSFMTTLEALAYLIDRISCEITCKCSAGGDAHGTSIAILNLLSRFSWEAKLVLALSAFAVTYGEFWLVAQSYTSNQLAKAVAILKQLPEILENSSVLKPQFDAIKNLIRAMVDVSKCIVEFRQLPTQYITTDVEALSTALAYIPVAVYWTIRSILACAGQLIGLTLLGREHMVSTTEAWELSSLAHKLSNMHSHLLTQLDTCNKHIDEKQKIEAYHNLVHLLQMSHIDNMRILRALIYPRDDLLPLVDGATKTRVNLEVLRRKNVLLLISDLDISEQELAILEQIYQDTRRQHPSGHDAPYEVVWIPIVDPWTDSKQQKFENLQAAMPWYTVYHPKLIDWAVIKFIKEVWNFRKNPILVVLDPHGKVVSPNALHMMWIWGGLAFPFTSAREEALWSKESWTLELLVDGIDPTILNWIAEGRYICLYGGEDIEWIRKFTNAAKTVAQAANIPLGMVYVGKSNPKERIRRNNATILAENLSHCLQDLTLIWYFWVRLECMWHSRNQLGRNVETDDIMREITTMLSYDGSEEGWAVFAKGSADLTRAKGSAFLTCLQEYNKWKDHVQEKGFLQALKDHLLQLHTPHHCNRLVLPGAAAVTLPKVVVCSECGRPMERFIMYRCCDE